MPGKKGKKATRKRTIKSVSVSPSIEPKPKKAKRNAKKAVNSAKSPLISPRGKKVVNSAKSPLRSPRGKKAVNNINSDDEDLDIDVVLSDSSSFSALDVDWADSEADEKVGSEINANNDLQSRLNTDFVQSKIGALSAWRSAKNTSVVVRVVCVSALSYRNNKGSVKLLVADGNGNDNFIRLCADDTVAAELSKMKPGMALFLRGVDIINNQNEYENVPHSAVIYMRPNSVIKPLAESEVEIPKVVLPTLTSISDINNMKDGQIISVVAHCRRSNDLLEQTRNGKDFRCINIMNHKKEIECRLYAKHTASMAVPENVLNKTVLLPFVRVNKFNGFQLTVSEDFGILDTTKLSDAQLKDKVIRNVLKVQKMSVKKPERFEKLVKGMEKLTVANYKVDWSSVCEKDFFIVMNDFQSAFRQQVALSYETVKCEAIVMGLVDVSKVSSEWYTIPKDESKGRKGLEYKGGAKWISKQTGEEFSGEEVMRKWCLKMRFNGNASGFGTKMTLFDEAASTLFGFSADEAYALKNSNINLYRERVESVKGKKVMLCLQMTKKKNLKSYGKSWYSVNVQDIHVITNKNHIV